VLLFAHADIRFTTAESEQPETETFMIGLCQKVVPLYIR